MNNNILAMMNQLKGNPIFQNAFKLYQNQDTKGLETLANNICNSKGIDINQLKNQVKNQFNIH